MVVTTAHASPLVSVVIPAYNACDYIEAAVRSAQAQTMRDIEIIVIDDASTDATPDIVRDLAADDARILVTRMEVNSGPGASRNRGLRLARGTWIALLDADDRFHPQRLETLLDLAQREAADIVADNVRLFFGERDSGQRIIPEARLSAPRALPFQEFVEGCMLDPSAPRRVSYVFMHPIVSREFLRQNRIAYNDANRNGEDFLFYVECFLAGPRWFVTPEAMYLYSVRDGSLTETQSRDDLRRMVERMRGLLRDERVLRDRKLAGAIRRHWRLIAGSYHYFGLKDAVLAADPKAAFRILVRDRNAAGFVARELIVRAPAMCRRVVRRYV